MVLEMCLMAVILFYRVLMDVFLENSRWAGEVQLMADMLECVSLWDVMYSPTPPLSPSLPV